MRCTTCGRPHCAVHRSSRERLALAYRAVARGGAAGYHEAAATAGTATADHLLAAELARTMGKSPKDPEVRAAVARARRGGR